MWNNCLNWKVEQLSELKSRTNVRTEKWNNCQNWKVGQFPGLCNACLNWNVQCLSELKCAMLVYVCRICRSVSRTNRKWSGSSCRQNSTTSDLYVSSQTYVDKSNFLYSMSMEMEEMILGFSLFLKTLLNG